MGLSLTTFTLLHVFNQPDRHRRRLDRNDRMVEVRSVANSDSDLSGYHDIDERNGVPLPLHQTAAVAYRGHDFISDAGVRNVRALRQASFRHLASDLHGRSPAVALLERIRSTCAGLPENSTIEGMGADSNGACVLGRAGIGVSPFLRSDNPGHRQISAGSGYCPLIRRLHLGDTAELYSLTVVSTATALMWVPYVLARMTTHGVMRAIGNPGAMGEWVVMNACSIGAFSLAPIELSSVQMRCGCQTSERAGTALCEIGGQKTAYRAAADQGDFFPARLRRSPRLRS